MLQFGGRAARPDGSISASVACGGIAIALEHPDAIAASASIKLTEKRIANEVSIRSRRGQETLTRVLIPATTRIGRLIV